MAAAILRTGEVRVPQQQVYLAAAEVSRNVALDYGLGNPPHRDYVLVTPPAAPSVANRLRPGDPGATAYLRPRPERRLGRAALQALASPIALAVTSIVCPGLANAGSSAVVG